MSIDIKVFFFAIFVILGLKEDKMLEFCENAKNTYQVLNCILRASDLIAELRSGFFVCRKSIL